MTEPVDVQKLMQEVKWRAGRRTVGADESPVPEEASPLKTLRENFDLLAAPMDSPRPGVGAVLTGLKRSLARLLVSVFHRQTTFNGAATRMLGNVSTRVGHLEGEIEHLERRILALDERVWKRMASLASQAAQAAREVGDGTSPRDAARETAPAAAALVPPEPFEQVALQALLRGPEKEIKGRQSQYVGHFVGQGPVLDVGCGRGEFLELLREKGIAARGVEGNPEWVSYCRTKGLEVVHADAFAHLEELADGVLGGVFCAQVIEHFPPSQMIRCIKLCARKLRRGGVVLFETPNAQCVAVFAGAFYQDFSHVWPYHPNVMKLILEAAGFIDVQTVFSSPLDPGARLPELRHPAVFGADTEAYNRAAVIVNRLLLGPQDYAIIGRKGDESP